jgi:membrane fusion protein (multidrug efflux system)
MATVVQDKSAVTGGSSSPSVNEAEKESRRSIVPIIVGIVALLVLGWGARHWWLGRNHVTTDNAQVEGHITPILPRVGGFVTEVRAAENTQVKEGDTLVILDDHDLRAKLAQSNAELNVLLASVGRSGHVGQATAQISVAKSGAAAANATITQAQANAQKANADLQRYKALAERNIISRQQLDAADAAARAANAQLTAAQQSAHAAEEQVTGASAGLEAADARVAAAQAARDQVQLQLNYTRVVSPAAGYVAKKSVEVGQLVQPGQPLMTVVPLTDTWVVANLKETDISDIKPGDKVEIHVDSYGSKIFEGHVESLSPATGARFSLLPPDNATGNFTKVVQRIPVRVHIDSPPDPIRPLRPGMSVDVDIATSPK